MQVQIREILKVSLFGITRKLFSYFPLFFFQFLYCIANGIPIVHHDWLDVSVKNRCIADYSAYVVPAGRDVTGDIIEQRLNPIKKIPLTGVKVRSFVIVEF